MPKKNQIKIADATVYDIMTRDVVTIDCNESAHRALELMDAERLTAIPVTTIENKCLGIISRTDLAEAMLEVDSRFQTMSAEAASLSSRIDGGESLNEIQVRELMNDKVLMIDHDAPVVEACKIMSQQGIHHLPVAKKKSVIGIISSLDVVEMVANL